MKALNTLLQSQTTVEGGETYTLDQLDAAAHLVSTAQEPIIESRAKTILKGIISDSQLWMRPVVATFGGVAYLVSGRHRSAALSMLVEDYYLNALGKLTRIPEGGIPEGGSELQGLINVEVIACASMKAVAKLQEAYNGSRSMTPAEKMLVKASFTALTPTEAAKQALARKFQAGLGVTFQTGLSIAATMSTKVKHLQYVTEGQADELVEVFNDYITSNPEKVPANLARDYKKLIDLIVAQQVPDFDEEGTATTISIIDSWGSNIQKPEKKATASKTNQLAEKLAAAMKALEAAGISLE